MKNIDSNSVYLLLNVKIMNIMNTMQQFIKHICISYSKNDDSLLFVYKYLFLFVVSLLFQTINAQTLTGIVIDKKNNPIPYANVVLYELPDTTYINGTITDGKGIFQFNTLLSSKMLLKISSLGYKTAYKPTITGQTIVLEDYTVEIGEVVVKGNRPISKLTTSGIETDIQNTILSQIGTGNDVLKRIPMLIGQDGKYKVFGKGDAKIYINNREVRDPSEIDNLNSTEIKKIEVITNPSARYDATVPAVIKIKTIRKQGDGISFNVRSSYYRSKNNDFIEQLNFNYRKNKVDVFSRIYYSNIISYEKNDVSQNVFVDTLWTQKNVIMGNVKSNKLNGIIGLNYEIDNDNSIGVRYDIKTSPQEEIWDAQFKSDITANGKPYDRWNNREYRFIKNRPISQANIYYAGAIKKLSIDLNVDYYTGRTTTNSIQNEVSKESGDRIINSINKVDNSLFSERFQLSYPVLKGILSFGNEYGYIHRKDDYLNEQISEYSSNIDLKEKNMAFFAEYNLQSKIGEFTVGIRYEDVKSEYMIDQELSEDKSRRYRQWFPNVSYSTRIKNVGLQLSYTTKVVRPTYRQLSNSLLYVNRFTLDTGNPYLFPSINRELSVTGVWKFMQAMLSYKQQHDAIIYVANQLEADPKVSVLSFQNRDKLPSFSAFIAIAPKFGIWKPQVSGGAIKQWLTIYSNDLKMKLNKPTLNLSFYNSFELPKDITITLDATYNGKGNFENMYLYKNICIVNFGIIKNFLNKKLQLKLDVNDIFNQNIVAVKFYNPQMNLSKSGSFDNREIAITLRYYFNKTNNKYKGSSSSDKIIERL